MKNPRHTNIHNFSNELRLLERFYSKNQKVVKICFLLKKKNKFVTSNVNLVYFTEVPYFSSFCFSFAIFLSQNHLFFFQFANCIHSESVHIRRSQYFPQNNFLFQIRFLTNRFSLKIFSLLFFLINLCVSFSS